MHCCIVSFHGEQVCALDYSKHMKQVFYQYIYTLSLANPFLQFKFFDMWDKAEDGQCVKFTADFIKQYELTPLPLQVSTCYLLTYPLEKHCSLCGHAACYRPHVADNLYLETLLSEDWINMGNQWIFSSPKLSNTGQTFVIAINTINEDISMLSEGKRIMEKRYFPALVQLIKGSYVKEVASLQSYCLLSILTNDIIDLLPEFPHLRKFRQLNIHIKQALTKPVEPFGYWNNDIIRSLNESSHYGFKNGLSDFNWNL